MERKYWIIWWWIGEKRWAQYTIDVFPINVAHQYKETEEHKPSMLPYSFLVVESNTDLSTIPAPDKK